MNHLQGTDHAAGQEHKSNNNAQESYVEMKLGNADNTNSVNDDRTRNPGRDKEIEFPMKLPNFIRKTYHILENCDPNIISWSEYGDTFIIKDGQKLASTILPTYFKHENLNSFTRQLSFYGFRKFRVTPELNSDVDLSTADYLHFYHANFQRGNVEALIRIKRRTNSNAQNLPNEEEVELLRKDIKCLNQSLINMQNDFDSKLTDLYVDLVSRLQGLHQAVNHPQQLNK